MKNSKFRWLYVVLPIVLVAGIGTLFVNLGMDWFNALTKPTQWIPNIVIPIVWTIIYLAFLIILLIWQNNDKIPLQTIILLAVNGVLNVLWCLLFFTFNLTFVGNIVIVLNLIAGFWLIFDIAKTKKLYSLILLIYPIWLSLATTLNLALWILN